MVLARGLGSFGPRLAGPIALRPVVRITADKRSEEKKCVLVLWWTESRRLEGPWGRYFLQGATVGYMSPTCGL